VSFLRVRRVGWGELDTPRRFDVADRQNRLIELREAERERAGSAD
jgi:hypothetical protein